MDHHWDNIKWKIVCLIQAKIGKKKIVSSVAVKLISSLVRLWRVRRLRGHRGRRQRRAL